MAKIIITPETYEYALHHVLDSACLLINRYEHKSYCSAPITAWLKCQEEPYKSWGNISNYFRFALKTTTVVDSPYLTSSPNYINLANFHEAFKNLALAYKDKSQRETCLETWAENYGDYFDPKNRAFTLPKLATQ